MIDDMGTDDRDTLREALRRGDPAADGRTPGREVFAAMRRRILAAEPSRRRAWRPYAPVFAAALLLLVVAGAAIRDRVRAPRPGTALPITVAGDDSRPGAGARNVRAQAGRKVEFTTAGGTRIVWILNPDLQI